MTAIDSFGYLAATLVFATFCAKSMVLLRMLAIASNGAFIVYGLSARLWPIVLLHSVMLPLNLVRLREAFGEALVKSKSSDVGQPSVGRNLG
jgi:CRP/FNR family transcriptional regulator, cyclic AMP receptor protein